MIGVGNFILVVVIGTFAAICLFILVLLARLMLRRNALSYSTPSASSRQTPRELIWTVTLPTALALGSGPPLRRSHFAHANPAAAATIRATGHSSAWTT